MEANVGKGRDRGATRRMDHRALRFAGCVAFGVFAVWLAVEEVLDLCRKPLAYSLRYYQHLPVGLALAVVAAYYGRAMAQGICQSRTGWILVSILIVLPAGIVWTTSGWDSAFVVALALAAWIPFAITWAVPVAGSLGIRGRVAKASLFLLFGAVPLAWHGLTIGVILFTRATADVDAPWRTGATVSVATSLAVLAAAYLITRRARRAARGFTLPVDSGSIDFPVGST